MKKKLKFGYTSLETLDDRVLIFKVLIVAESHNCFEVKYGPNMLLRNGQPASFYNGIKRLLPKEMVTNVHEVEMGWWQRLMVWLKYD